ncbi:hypothetical protein GGI23_000811 [Coemansia sp. RSA 2559]|nr:hypothetical protein GGI23_000811 [Coemansia sp. RSA 2559]KAJ2867978.1 hypothetical protein GGI22_000925 [Coemansia erecta]
MSQSDWETNSDYRQFNPGMYAMRQLGRSVSRRTKKLMQTARNRQDAGFEQTDGQGTRALDDELAIGTGANSTAGNGYLVYDFDNTDVAAGSNGAGEVPHRRSPPQPSGIHRRSLSFDNLVVIPDSIPRRSTEPAIGTEPNPQSVGLPESSTWNSGNTMTRTAAVEASEKSVHAVSLRLGHVYDATRRRWVPDFAYSPHPPRNVDTSNGDTRLSLSTRLPAHLHAGGVLQEWAPHSINGRHRKSSASKRARHNRESFSGPAQLDASTNFSESQTSAVNASDQFQDHHRMWRGEEAANAEAHREPEVLVAMAEIAAAAAAAAAANTSTIPAGVGVSGQNSGPRGLAHEKAGAATPKVLPSMPVSSGLFRRKSSRSQNPASRESSQRRAGGFARVIGNISRRLNRIRSNRSASQPATPAEIRNSILESARQNMLNGQNGNGYGFYRFVVNPTDPVSDSDSLEPDSPTISHHPSSARPSRLQRSTSFPSNGVGSARYPPSMPDKSDVDQAQYATAIGAVAPVPGYAISNMYNTTAVNINEIGRRSAQIEFVQLESLPVSRDTTFSTVHRDVSRRAAAFHSGPSHRRVSSDSAWLRQTQRRGSPFMTNQGHDGSLSAIVQAKLESKFIDSVHVSTRLNSDSNTDSSYGTFVRFHNSGELNDIFTAEHGSQRLVKSNANGKQSDHHVATGTLIARGDKASAADDRLQKQQQSAEHTPSREQRESDEHDNTPLNGTAGVGAKQEWRREPSHTEAVFVSTRRGRTQENIRQFVGEMRAAREDSVRRRRDAEMRRQDILNDQAVLDATVYVFERQQKKDAHDRQRIEQMQQLLEEQQLEYLKDKLSERLQQQQQQQAPQIPETDVLRSSTANPVSGGGGCVPPMVPAIISGRRRLKHRRQSEGVRQRDAVVKEGGRRRATVFGMFCTSNEGVASSDSIVAPLPTRLVRKDFVSPSPFGPAEKARMATQLDKELPPLPIAHRHNGLFQTDNMGMERDKRLEQAVPNEGRSSPLRRSRSFSHFGSSERIAPLVGGKALETANDPWSHRTDPAFDKTNILFIGGRNPGTDALAGFNPSQQEEEVIVFDAKERRMFRAGALRGVLGMFAGNNGRRKSNAQHADASDKDKRYGDSRRGNRRTALLNRGQRRHTLGVPEADSESDGISLPVHRSTDANIPALNVHISVPEESLSTAVYAGFVQSATDDAQSSSRRRMYSHILTTLQGSDVEPIELEPAPTHNRNLRMDSNGKAGDQPQAPANNRQSDADGWRDSAITGVLTQVSAGTSLKHGSAAIESSGVPIEQVPAKVIDQTKQYRHVVRFEEAAGSKARTSSLALDTITARTESGELFKQRAKHNGKSMARSTPHSHSASQVVSSDGSFADMVASTNADAYRFHLADLPGLEGFDTPSTNDAILSPGLSTPRHLPANERLRRLENEIFYSGKQSRPTTSDSDRANVGRPNADMPFDSPISDAGTGRTQILDFAEAHIQTEMGSGLGSKYRRPSARPEIRDVRGIAWGDTNPTTTAAESVEAPGASIGLADDMGLFAGHPAEKKQKTDRSMPDNGTTDTLGTLGSSARRESAAVATFTPDKYGAADDVPLAEAVGVTTDDFSRQPSDSALLAKLVQTSPDPRKLIYDASSQFGTMRSPSSLDAKGVSESNMGHRELLADIAARIAKHNLPADIVSMSELPVVIKSLSAPSVTPSPRNTLTDNQHMFAEDGRRVTNSRSSLGLNAASGDDRILRQDSDLLATTADSDAVARASTQAIKSFEPIHASRTDPNAAVGGPKSSNHAITSGSKQDIHGLNIEGGTKHSGQFLAFQEYVEQQRKLPKDRSSHAGIEQLNFRVSLLDRPMPEYSRRSRSVSLPAPQRTASGLAKEVRQQRRPSAQQQTDAAIHALRPFVHQRPNSFYDSPPLVQALLQPDLPPNTDTTHSKSQGADEEIAERALFSHLLGDGAALTSPDLKLARRQSNASSLVPAAPQLFDPIHDTGENGVPDSVLRAYLAGDIMAIERFFEHIMRITAPSSVYEGEISEDGDWTYGLEGPPPGFAAKKTTAKNDDLLNASREVPGMADASATASHDVSLSHNLQQQSVAIGSNSGQTPPDPALEQNDRAAVAAEVLSVSRDHVGPDTSCSTNIASDTHSNYSSHLLGSKLPQKEASSVHESSPMKVSDEAKEMAPAETIPPRKIAIPRLKFPRVRRSNSSVNEGMQRNDASIRVEVHQSVENSAAGMLDSTPPPRPRDDPIKLAFSEIRENDVVEDLVHMDTPVSRVDNVQCLSPERLPAHDHHHHHRCGQSGASQRMSIPVVGPRSKKQEKQLLLTRLRVLEGMIQKSAIEESRLQPPPALHEPQLAKDMESLASIYSSSMELDYDRINMELSRSVRNSADKRQSAGMYARPSPLAKTYDAPPNAVPQSAQTPETQEHTEVLKRLRRSSQARARTQYRASVLNRQTFASPGQSTERMSNKAQYTKKWHGRPLGVGSASRAVQTQAKGAAVSNASVLSEVSDAAYSARSGGSIRIEIVEESPFAGSLGSGVANAHYRQHALPLPSTSRFRRSAKLLT